MRRPSVSGSWDTRYLALTTVTLSGRCSGNLSSMRTQWFDAGRALDVFVVRLRDKVDLDSVRAAPLDVVGDTLRPAGARLWLREPRR